MKITNYVNEEKRTVVAVISDYEYDVIRKVRKLFRNHLAEDFCFNGQNSYLLGPIRGKARCAPEDTFDIEEGIAIARQRAFDKYNAKFNKEIDFIIERLELAANGVDSLRK